MKAWILTAFAFIGIWRAAAETYTYQTLNLPGAPVGIDRAGNIAGNYKDSAGTHGYVYAGGVLTSLADGYSVINLNQNGELLLQDTDGFATYANGIYTQLTLPIFTPPGFPVPPPVLPPGFKPTPPPPLLAGAINDSGELLVSSEFSGVSYPFLLNGNQLTALPTIAIHDTGSVTYDGLSDSGVALGTLGIAVHCCGFYAQGGLYDPSTGTWNFVSDNNGDETFLQALNNSGQAVGDDLYFIGAPDFAVVYQNGVFTPVAPVGSTFSAALGINDAGTIVGVYESDNPVYYLATPGGPASSTPEPSLAGLSLLGLAAVFAIRHRTKKLRSL